MLNRFTDDAFRPVETLEKFRSDQRRDSHGRFAPEGRSPDGSMPESSWGLQMDGWPDSQIKLSAIGTKELPTGWDYKPASKAPDLLAEACFTKGSRNYEVAKIYYTGLSKNGELEFYKHSSGLIMTFEGKMSKMPDAEKHRAMQNMAELYKANKNIVEGTVIVRFNEEVAKGRSRSAWAGDERHNGAGAYGTNGITSIATTQTKMIASSTGNKHVLTHEFGHILRFSNTKETQEYQKDVIQGRYRGAWVSKTTYKNNSRGDSLMGAEKRRPRIHLSNYSKDSVDEWYAEAFTFWIHGGGSFDKMSGLSVGEKTWLENFAKDQEWKMPK